MDDTFVNVWLDSEEHIDDSKKDFYKSWIHKASAKHSDPALIGADRLRKLYPKHSVVSTNAYDLSILSFPGLTATPLPNSPLITDLFFVPFARSLHGVPGVLVDQVRIGAFEVAWQSYEFLLYVASYPASFGGTITQSYILHEGPEERARLLLLSIGAWSHELHDEIWVFNQGFWNKDHGLWEEIQKANWNDVILKEDFKKALQKDVYGFFSAEEVYKKLSIPWKRGLIMYGPPGNGKTISVKAIMKSCSENGFVPLYVKSFQSWKGEEGAMEDVFNQARQVSPSCLILEDLDSLINDRNRSYFLNQLDGLSANHGLFILGTTNHFDRLDPGLSSRPSRFDRKYLFDDPDSEERALYAKYWQNKLSGNPEIDFPDSLIHVVVELTPGFSFAYLKEAFVSTLVTLAGIPADKPSFAQLLKDQILELRKQLEEEIPKTYSKAITLAEPTASSSWRPKPSVVRNDPDVRILFDASNNQTVQGNSHEKIYRSVQTSEPQQFDAEARRVRVLLDSLSESISNANTSPRIYHPFAPRGTRHDLERDTHPDKGDGNSSDTAFSDLFYRLSRPYGQGAASSNISQRQLPTPPGPPGMGWERPMFSGPAPPSQSQPVHHGCGDYDPSDLA